MSDYFHITEQFVMFQIMKLQKEYHKQIVKKDTIVDLLIEELFSSTDNNYLAQFSLCKYLNISLIANRTDWIEKYSYRINSKLSDSFLKNGLLEHYARVANFNNNPKRFSDALLSSNNNFEQNNGVNFQPDNEKNTVRDLIEANPGKVIFVDFWAPWCPPCLHNMQFSKQLITDFKGRDVEFAFVCINSKEDLWKETVNK